MISYPEAALRYIEATEVVRAYRAEFDKARAAWKADEGAWSAYDAALAQWSAAVRDQHNARQVLNHLEEAERLAAGWARLKALPRTMAVPPSPAARWAAHHGFDLLPWQERVLNTRGPLTIDTRRHR